MTTQAHPRLAALERANTVRLARAELKARLHDAGGEAPAILADILRDPTIEFQRIEIGELLTWLPRWGNERVRRYLTRRQINPLYEIAGERAQHRNVVGVLTARQRQLIAKDFAA